MSVTARAKVDPIPHGLKGYREPWLCRCDVCREANTTYHRNLRHTKRADQLAARRKTSTPKKRVPKTESPDSVGEMERAVIDECATIDNPKPTLVVAAKNLGRSVDDLTGNAKVIALYNSTMKQLMATMAEMRGDKAEAKVTGRRKSGGRLATVGALTKVRRAQ